MRKIQSTRNSIKAVIFDLDDTLYPEDTFVRSGLLASAVYFENQYGVDKRNFFKELIDILKKDGRGKIFDSALKKHEIYSRDLVRTLVCVYRSHTPRIRVYRGLHQLLSSLRKRYYLAIITDGVSCVQRNKVEALGIKNLVDLIIYTDDCGKGKPKPHVYAFKKATKYFKVHPIEAIYIGDDPKKDFQGPRKLHMTTIRVLQGRFKNVKLSGVYGAEYTAKSIGEAIKLIEMLNK